MTTRTGHHVSNRDVSSRHVSGRHVAIGLLLGLGIGSIASHHAGAAEIPGIDFSLESVPAPDLTEAEVEIRQQLETTRTETEIAFQDSAGPVETRATAAGRLGRRYQLYGFQEAAEAAFRLARDLHTDAPQWHYHLAVLWQEDRLYTEADKALAAVITRDPRNVPARIRRAQIALEERRLDEAASGFQVLLDEDPSLAAGAHGLAQVAEMRGDFETAARYYERALTLQPRANALHYPLALAYRQLGQIDRAREQIAKRGTQQIRFTDPLLDSLGREAAGNATLLVAGNEAMARRDYPTAVSLYRAAVEAQPNDIRARMVLASAQSLAGRLEEALATYRAAIEQSPTAEPVAHFNVGNLLRQKGNSVDARASYERALDAAPDYANAHINMATLLDAQGELDDALVHARRAAELEQDDVSVQLLVARIEARRGDVAAARAAIEAILERTPGSVSAWSALGSLAAREGETDAAVRAFRKAIDAGVSDPALVDIRRSLASLEPARAVEHLEAAIALRPADPMLARQLGAAHGRAGQFANAATAYRNAIASAPNDLEAHFGLATALILAGQHQAARDALESGLASLPDAIPLTHALGRLLATSAIDSLRDGDRALALATQVFQLRPSLDHAETMGMALAELGRFDEAIALQQQLIERAQRSGEDVRVIALVARRDQYQRGEPVRDRRGLDG